MTNIIEEILSDAKLAYKESVIIENEVLEEYLLSIIGNAKSIINNNTNTIQRKPIAKDVSVLQSEEIQKVFRKVPRWLNNPSQYNSIILNNYMSLSENNMHPISVSLLEQHADIENGKFMSHFNQMKMISERNHAKVFDEEYGQVKLWEPVADFIVKQ